MVIQEMTTQEIQNNLKNRTIDVGILAIPLMDKQLVEVELYTEPFVIFDCKEEKIKSKTSLEDLDLSNFWLLEEGHCLRTQVQQICDLSKNKNNKNIAFKAGSLGSLMGVTKANRGATILPYLTAINLNEKDIENLVHFKSPLPVRSIGLVTHQHFVKKKLLIHLEKAIIKSVVDLLPKTTNLEVIRPV